VLAGAAAIAKLSLVPFALIMGLALMWPARLREPALFSLGGVLGAMPVLVRNAVLASNPVYPWLQSIFPTSSTLLFQGLSERAATLHATQFSFRLDSLPSHLLELLQESPLPEILAWPALAWGLWKFGTLRRPAIIFFATALLFTLVLRPMTEVRYQGPTLVALALLTTSSVALSLASIHRRLQWAAALACLAASNLSFFTLLQLGSSKFSTLPVRATALKETGAPAKLWIRKNLEARSPLLVVGDGYPYYLLDFNMTQYSRIPGLEALIVQDQTQAALDHIAATSYSHVYFNSTADFVGYRPAISRILSGAAFSWPRTCLRGSGEDWQVWSLPCIREQRRLHEEKPR
jgi:hypothetical protein